MADEITSAAVADVANAIERAFKVEVGYLNWNAEARAAIAAALPHLTAERDTENARLRAALEQIKGIRERLCVRITTAEAQLETALADASHDRAVAAVVREENRKLREQVAHLTKLHDERDAIERSRMNLGPNPTPEVAVAAPEQDDEIDRFDPDYCPAELAFDNRHSPEYFKRDFLCAWCHADPAPSTPAALETPDA